MQDTIPTETRERIIQAANTLFQEQGKAPTVDQVRRTAKADMNTTSAVMREWRRSMSAPAPVAATQVPEALAQAHSHALVTMWTTAQELASDTLRNAQAGWEAERAELEQMRAELAEAAEQIERDAEQARQEALAREAKIWAENGDLKATGQRYKEESEEAWTKLREQAERATKAEAKAEGQEEMILELRKTIGQLHQDCAHQRMLADRATRERDEALEKAQELRIELESKLPEAHRLIEHHKAALHSAEYEVRELRERLDQERKERVNEAEKASEAREKAAEYKGRMETLDAQNRELLKAIGTQKQQNRERAAKA